MTELKPCPFCGGSEIYAEVSYQTKEFRIYCANADTSCVAGMRFSFADAGLGNGEIIDFQEMTKIIKELVDMWNRRAENDR
ncbi:MAG: Lar family restriction alleviation protein [Clostridia bacterium]|nr:Lar family restriction alleviation protein [Clostridia bacterium]